MLFNSSIFFVFFVAFLPLFGLGVWLTSGRAPRPLNALLLTASYVFYGAWDYRFLSLIAISTVVDYISGLRIDASRDEAARGRWLRVSLGANLGLLFVFKYFGFFVASAVDGLNALGVAASRPSLSIILPVGISFYTFQTMSYSIDIYRRRLKPTRDLLVFATYVAFFPQLVAGPIVRASRLIPQLEHGPAPSVNRFFYGLMLAAGGFFLKMAVADSIAVLVDHTYRNVGSVSYLNLAIGVLYYSFQIYADFNGYSLIAIGIGWMLGYDLGVNFRRPYLSTGYSDFWRRWHVSLSAWLRDYLYIPLGGSRVSVNQTYRNLMLTMLLGGLWHGASWNFVIWGGLHGIYLAVERFAVHAGWIAETPAGATRVARQIGTFSVVTLTWIFFRSQSFADTKTIFSRLFSWSELDLRLATINMLLPVGVCGLLITTLVLFEAIWERAPLKETIANRPTVCLTAASMLVWGTALLGNATAQGFIYFQF